MIPSSSADRNDAAQQPSAEIGERDRALLDDLDPESPGFAERHPDLWAEIQAARTGPLPPPKADLDDIP